MHGPQDMLQSLLDALMFRFSSSCDVQKSRHYKVRNIS